MRDLRGAAIGALALGLFAAAAVGDGYDRLAVGVVIVLSLAIGRP